MCRKRRAAGEIDGAIVSAVGEEDAPCFPSPKVVTTRDEIKAAAGSWYTYCENNLALTEVREKDLKKVAFVGVPCQITPLRKMEYMDPSFLVTKKKKPKIVSRQRQYLRGFSDRIAFNIGLFCTEVFVPELMTERIEKRMGIPLTDIKQFNIKGEILIYKKNGDLEKIPLKEAMEEFQRPACSHCGDFSAELADIACGGIGTDRATVIIIRTKKGEEIWRKFEATGTVEVETIEDNKRAWNVLQRLSRRQRGRVPVGAPRSGTEQNLNQYHPYQGAKLAMDKVTHSGKDQEEINACMEAVYENESRPVEIVGFMAGQPIHGDPGPPAEGEKRKLPKPITPEQGGASPCWKSAE